MDGWGISEKIDHNAIAIAKPPYWNKLVLEKVIEAVSEHNYTVCITADHGNIESMFDGNQPQTAHTYNNMPLLVADKNVKI